MSTRNFGGVHGQPMRAGWASDLQRNLFALAFAGAFAAPMPSALAATINVNNTSCTLAEAIANANTNTNGGGNGCSAGAGTADTLVLPSKSDISLSSALPRITSNLTIEGSRSTVRRVSTAPAFAIFRVSNASAKVKMQDLTISGGKSGSNAGTPESSAGGVFNAGNLTLTRISISNNTGNGIRNTGRLTVSNSTVSDNGKSGAGGGISNDGTATLSNSTFFRNTAPLSGGAIINSNDPQSGRIGTITITNCTLSGNSATESGGGITNSGVLRVFDTTISSNTAGQSGGGIHATASVAELDGGKLDIRRSLVTGNVAPKGSEIVLTDKATLVNDSFNVLGHSGRTTAQALSGLFPAPSDRTATSDGSHPTALSGIRSKLALNAPGKTQTHALPTSSPAVNASGSTCSATDQRGISRPQRGACDAGAFELPS